MIIQDALKENGRAKCNEDGYVFVDEYGILQWYDTVNNVVIAPAELNEILNSDWQPHHEKKEIRPEKAGELWKLNEEEYFIFFDNDKEVCLCTVDIHGDKCLLEDVPKGELIHNQNGWKRLFPSVEDGSVERIIVEDATLFHGILDHMPGNSVITDKLAELIVSRGSYGLKAKVTFEIPKEQK